MQHFMTRTVGALLFLFGATSAFSQIHVVRDRMLCPGESISLGGNTYNSAGTYTVNLPGSGSAPDTVAIYNLQVLSGVSNPQACNCHPETFYKTLGSTDDVEYGTALTPTADGNLYFAGRKGSRTFIEKINPSGEVIWTRDFVLNQFLPITPNELIEDSEGMIVGCGTQGILSGFIRAYVFRYDPVSDQLLWARELTGNNPVAGGILEKGAGGNYVYYQTLRLSGGETDVEILEFNRTTGNLTGPLNLRYQYQSSDFIGKLLLRDGILYGGGWSTSGAQSAGETHRMLFTALNPADGIPYFNLLSHTETSAAPDYFGRDMVSDGNNFILGGDGRDSLTGASSVFLQKMSPSGQILWINRYEIGGRVLKVLSFSDGYIVYVEQTDSERSVFKTDKNGAVLWAKSIATGAFGGVNPNGFGPAQAVAVGNHVMLTGVVPGGSYDAFLMKIAPDGTLADSCGILQDVNIPFSVVQDPVLTPIQLSTSASTATVVTVNAPPQTATLFEQLVCPDCVAPNPCPEGNDFVVDMLGTTCGDGTVNLRLKICDLDGGALPGSINLAFYDANPTLGPAQHLGDFQFLTNGADSCALVTLNNIAVELGSQAAQDGYRIYAVVNFEGVVNTPISFDDFPVTDLEECDYTNNLDSLVIDNPNQPVLDLGPDRIVCAGTAVQLDAGPDFYKYKWSNGAASRKINVSASGNYAVTVTDECGFLQNGTVHVEIKAWPTKQVNASICPGGSFEFNGRIFTNGGFFADTLASASAGCDTVVSIFVEQLPYNSRTVNVSFCPNHPVTINGVEYSESGLVRDTVPGTVGCDTIIRYVLSELPRPFRYDNVYLCPGGSVTIGGVLYSQAGTYRDTIPSTSSTSCDTILYLQVEILPQVTTNDTIRFCQGSSVNIGGQTYTQPGLVTSTTPGFGGDCDTLNRHLLEWLPAPTRTQDVAFCPGSSVTIGGQIYTQPGTVTQLVPGSGGGCDTVLTYNLSWLPGPTRSETIEFCQGSSVSLGGQNYTQPGTVVLTVPGSGSACDTVVTYTLQYLNPPAGSNMSVKCPDNINIPTIPGAGPQVVNYPAPSVTTDCICPGADLHLDAGLASGALFPVGVTKVCYTATDRCNSTASCCFNVTVREELPCDTKTSGCIKYDILGITTDAIGRYTYRIKVTNNCAAKMIYTAFELPDGLTAFGPANNSAYTSPDGRVYLVRNPNFTPFYSVRFKSLLDSISGGQSDVFEYTLPPQSHPTYIHAVTRVAPQTTYEAVLNTIHCPVTLKQQLQNRNEAEMLYDEAAAEYRVNLFPNPSTGLLYADLTRWNGRDLQLRLIDGTGRLVQAQTTRAESDAQRLDLPENLPSGMYFLHISAENGDHAVERFIIER